MGVITTSDRKRDEAKEHIAEAYKCLLEVLDIDTYGSDEYGKDYLEILEEVTLTLVTLKRKL